ncbi:hypothetical protein ACC687_40965 [Rhizobium ruizarguesonis]
MERIECSSSQIGDIVNVIDERALESYEIRETGREAAKTFYARLSQQSGKDIDLESVLKEDRQAHKGIEL